VETTGYQVGGAAILAIVLVTGAVMLGWIIWGFREYRRTGRAQWLWMGVVMLVGLVVSLGRLT
jgi:heme A synthase